MRKLLYMMDIVRTYWNTQPCNIKHSKLEVGKKEYFNEVEQRKYFVEPHIPNFAQFEKWKGKTVLEIGGGIGTDSINFARAGANLTIIELSETSMEIIKKRFDVFGLKANFYVCDAEKLTDTIGTEIKYDLVYSFGVIHHTQNPENVIEEIKKILKPDGELRIMMYAKYSTKNFFINLGLMQPEAQTGCPIAYTYSKNELVNLLNGYEIISSWKEHIFYYKINEYKQYKYVYSFPWNIMPMRLCKFMEYMFGWHYLVIAKLKK